MAFWSVDMLPLEKTIMESAAGWTESLRRVLN